MNKIITNTGITAGDVCPKCLGSGKVKAMQMARYINGPTVRVEDTREPALDVGEQGGAHSFESFLFAAG